MPSRAGSPPRLRARSRRTPAGGSKRRGRAHLRDLRRPDLGGELRVDRVVRERRRLHEVDRPRDTSPRSSGPTELVAQVDERRLRGVRGLGRDAVAECRREHEGLEGGARLPLALDGEVELALSKARRSPSPGRGRPAGRRRRARPGDRSGSAATSRSPPEQPPAAGGRARSGRAGRRRTRRPGQQQDMSCCFVLDEMPLRPSRARRVHAPRKGSLSALSRSSGVISPCVSISSGRPPLPRLGRALDRVVERRVRRDSGQERGLGEESSDGFFGSRCAPPCGRRTPGFRRRSCSGTRSGSGRPRPAPLELPGESAASFTFRAIVRSQVWSSMFLTNCCVIVEPPWTNSFWERSAQSARAMPRMSTRCSQKRRSPAATMACFMTGAMSSDLTTTRFSSPRSVARRVPSAAKM